MKALLPVYCRPLGYFVMALALFLPFLMVLMGKVTDGNLLFYKECSKLLMMVGALMILFALHKHESRETEQIRNGFAQRYFPDSLVYLRWYALSGGQRRYCECRHFVVLDILDS